MPLIIRQHIVYPPRPAKVLEPVKRSPGIRRDCIAWTPDRDALVVKCYDRKNPEPLAIKLGCTVGALRMRASHLGVTRR